MSGKGSAPRPFAVEQDEYGANWGAIDWNARERAEAQLKQEAEQPSQPAAD